jgi:hypothetical protein
MTTLLPIRIAGHFADVEQHRENRAVGDRRRHRNHQRVTQHDDAGHARAHRAVTQLQHLADGVDAQSADQRREDQADQRNRRPTSKTPADTGQAVLITEADAAERGAAAHDQRGQRAGIKHRAESAARNQKIGLRARARFRIPADADHAGHVQGNHQHIHRQKLLRLQRRRMARPATPASSESRCQ